MTTLNTVLHHATFHDKYSVTRTAVPRLLTLLLMASYIITFSQSLSINTKAIAPSPWWCQPCQMKHKTRHSRGINEPIKSQFKIAIVNYENIVQNYIKQLNTKMQIKNMTKKQFKRNNWLPRKKFFRSLQRDNEKILPELHYQLQVYAVTIEKLLKMEIRSQDASFSVESRKKVLILVKNDIKLLLCETELEMEERRLKKAKEVPSNLVDKKIPAFVNHLTEGLLSDYSILKDYYNFLKKCFNRIFGRVKKNRNKVKSGKRNKQRQQKRIKTVLNKKLAKS